MEIVSNIKSQIAGMILVFMCLYAVSGDVLSTKDGREWSLEDL